MSGPPPEPAGPILQRLQDRRSSTYRGADHTKRSRSYRLGVGLAAVCLMPAVSLAQAAPGRAGRDVVPTAPGEIIVNGDFERDEDGDGWPDGWPRHKGASAGREGGNTWLVLAAYVSPGQTIKLDPDWWKLKVSCRMRTTDVVVGDQSWKNARLAMNFVDENGKHVDPWPNVFHAQGTTDWTRHEREYRVPAGAKALHVNPSMFGASGRAEFDDVSVTVSRLRSRMKEDVPLPKEASGAWDMATAWRRKSETREKVCLNGLWRFLPLSYERSAFEALRPTESSSLQKSARRRVVKPRRSQHQEAGPRVPSNGEGWGWFKVPGIWPRSTDRDAQRALISAYVEERVDLGKFDQAWYTREIVTPRDWSGRRILVEFTLVQTHARVFLDDRPVGEVWFPGGPVDVTDRARPGKKQDLAVLVTARPLEKESQVFMAPDRIIKSKATVDARGLTGDVFLVSEPRENALGDVHVITSTREKKITLDTEIRNAGEGPFKLEAQVLDGGKTVKTFESGTFGRGDMEDGRVSVSAPWADPKLWDTDAPENVYEAVVTLSGARGEVLDRSLPVRFGFREFRIDGRDFLLNEKRIHLRALLARNITVGADLASVEGSRRTCRRMQDYGFNFLITNNYHFKPGAVGYMDGLFTAADETGMLCAFSLPHIRDFSLDPEKPDTAAPYRRLTEWLVRRVQNHPSIVLYAMSHNACGYYGDQNPLRIDGVFSPEDPDQKGSYRRRIRGEALMAGRISRELDPTRPVYHHQSGNLGDMHTVNIYLNWAPRQERSDWLEHWATEGRKPLFFVEWGLPHVSSWSSYRGPAFIWRTEAYQQIWDSEYAAAHVGQKAYRMTETKVKSMAHEEDLWSRGKPFHWGWLNRHLQAQEENYLEIQASFCDDNWRSHRTWGISSMLPWDQGGMCRRRAGRAHGPKEVGDPYADLQRPGISPDVLMPSGGIYNHYMYALDGEDIEPTSLGRSFLRWNMPLCAYIGGAGNYVMPRFTEKGHNFLPGETVKKQLVLLNDTRRGATCDWSWKLAPAGPQASGKVTVAPGGKVSVAVAVPLAADTKPGGYALSARFDFGEREVQEDALDIDVVRPAECRMAFCRVALFDPKGMTAKLLGDLGVKHTKVDADADLAGFQMLVIGREALTVDGACPDLSRVRDGLKVLVFEQTYDVLVNRLGFRANVHGMRRAFVRAAGHPALEGLADRHLRDWRGAATLVRPHLQIEGVETSDPKWNWLGFQNTRAWRCGNHGCVASVLIEKPPRGDFTPLVDCGFDLQYAPLLEYVEGHGRVVFCQLDVTGRTEDDPVARGICTDLLSYLDCAPSRLSREVLYAGDERGAGLLERLGLVFERYASQRLGGRTLLVLGPGAGNVSGLDAAFARGLDVLSLGLGEAEIAKLLPGTVEVEERKVVPSLVESFARRELRGISNAELHWKTLLETAALKPPPEESREAKESNEASRVIEKGPGRIVLCQAAPWMFDYVKKPYLRTTYRRNVFLVSRLLSNLGARFDSRLLGKFGGAPEVFDFPLPKAWKGLVDREEVGEERGWNRPDFDDSEWKPIEVPGAFDRQVPGLADYDGVFWYRIRFEVPVGLAREGLEINLGGIDDESWTWLNGKFLGEVTKQTNPKDYWNFPRVYEMKPGMLRRDGENVLVVRCRDTYLSGGIMGSPRLSAPGPWVKSYYLQEPEAVDDPYRYYRW